MVNDKLRILRLENKVDALEKRIEELEGDPISRFDTQGFTCNWECMNCQRFCNVRSAQFINDSITMDNQTTHVTII